MMRLFPFILATAAVLISVSSSAQTNSATLQEMGDKVVIPYKITILDEAIDDLNRRLSSTRLPDQLEGVSWEYGTELGALSDLIAYWREGFDWRAQESTLNSFDQFMVVVEGANIHTLSTSALPIPMRSPSCSFMAGQARLPNFIS